MKSITPPLFLVALACVFLSASKPSAYVVGDRAANFSLRNVDGRMVSLADYESAKGLIVVFTCNHCPYAQLYEDRIIALHKNYAPKGFPVVAINPSPAFYYPDDSYASMQQRAKEKRYPFAYLHDEKQEVRKCFGASRTPQVFVLDDDFVVRYVGGIDDNPESVIDVKKRHVENAVNALLRGERPSPDMTKVLGCTIKDLPPSTTGAAPAPATEPMLSRN